MSEHSAVHRGELRELDSTQTVRAINLSELYDSHAPRWYAIQLVVSERPVNLDLMPRLEVFAAHRLYAVAGEQQNATRYALRLGFFSDEASAEPICGYMRSFFSSPSIVRVSVAEQARFAQPAAARAAVQQPTTSSTPVARAGASLPIPSAAALAVPRQAVAQRPATANKPANTLRPIRASGSQKLVKKTRTLAEELMEEAREVQLSRSGKHRAVSQSQSWLARLFGAPKR